MPWACSACDQARASAIWPIAAAAWLSSSFSAPLGRPGDGAAERDGAGRDDDEVGAALVQRGDVGDQRVEPFLLQRAARAVDEQRRADLDDNAGELVEAGRFGHGAAAGDSRRPAG